MVSIFRLLSSRAAMKCRSRCERCGPEPSISCRNRSTADRLLEAIDLAMKPIVPSAAAERQSEIAESTATRFARLTPARTRGARAGGGWPTQQGNRPPGLGSARVRWKNYRARGLEKLGTRSLAELVRLAVVAEASGVWIFPR